MIAGIKKPDNIPSLLLYKDFCFCVIASRQPDPQAFDIKLRFKTDGSGFFCLKRSHKIRLIYTLILFSLGRESVILTQ